MPANAQRPVVDEYKTNVRKYEKRAGCLRLVCLLETSSHTGRARSGQTRNNRTRVSGNRNCRAAGTRRLTAGSLRQRPWAQRVAS